MKALLFLGLLAPTVHSSTVRHYIVPAKNLYSQPSPFWRVPLRPDATPFITEEPAASEFKVENSVPPKNLSTPAWAEGPESRRRKHLQKALQYESLRLKWLKSVRSKKQETPKNPDWLSQRVARTLDSLEIPWSSWNRTRETSTTPVQVFEVPPWVNLQFVARRIALGGLVQSVRRMRRRNVENGEAFSTTYETSRGLVEIQLRKPRPKARVCILVDDVGYSGEGIDTYLAMNMPVTISVLPFYDTSAFFARKARQLGFEVMLHMPMQSSFASYYKYENLIKTKLSEEELSKRVKRVLAAVPLIQGINNHEGSKATEDSKTMEVVMREIARHGYYFVDSVTSQRSVAYKTARKHGLPASRRSFDFLDNTKTIPAISHKIDQLIEYSLKHPEKVVLTILHEKTAPAKALDDKLVRFRNHDIEILSPSDFLFP